MTVYITGTAMSVLFAYISTHIANSQQLKPNGKKTYPAIFAVLSFLPLTIIMAVRYNVGTDFRAYWRAYLYPSNYMETGYLLLTKLLRFFSYDPQTIFIVAAIIICTGYFFAIYKESIAPAYSVLLFVLCRDYFIAMNGMRQYIAAAIMLFAVPCIKNKNWAKALIVLAIAFLFHKSVVVFIPLCVLYMIEIPPLVGGGLVLGTYLFSSVVRQFILPLLSNFGFYINYFSSSFYGNREGDFNWFYTLVFLSFFILLSYEYKNVKAIKELKLMYSAVLLSLLIISLSAVMPSNVYRLTWYMNPILVIYIPSATKALHNKKLRWFMNVAIVVAYAVVTIPAILEGTHDVLPYQTFWNHQ